MTRRKKGRKEEIISAAVAFLEGGQLTEVRADHLLYLSGGTSLNSRRSQVNGALLQGEREGRLVGRTLKEDRLKKRAYRLPEEQK